MPHDESSARFGRITLGRLDEAFRAILGEEEGNQVDRTDAGADSRLRSDLHLVALEVPRRSFRNCDGPPPDDCSLGHLGRSRVA